MPPAHKIANALHQLGWIAPAAVDLAGPAARFLQEIESVGEPDVPELLRDLAGILEEEETPALNIFNPERSA